MVAFDLTLIHVQVILTSTACHGLPPASRPGHAFANHRLGLRADDVDHGVRLEHQLRERLHDLRSPIERPRKGGVDLEIPRKKT